MCLRIHLMEEKDKRKVISLLIFNILAPTVDLLTDVRCVVSRDKNFGTSFWVLLYEDEEASYTLIPSVLEVEKKY